MRQVVSFLLFTTIGLLFAGCGTTHHFLPPRPLEKNEAMISLAWHFDLGMIHVPDMFPDANVYIGTGNNYNLGLGLRPPLISFNHLTVVKYWPTDGDDYWAAYGQINQIIGTNNNPYFEAGGAYIVRDNSLHQTFSAGLGVGGGLAVPVLDLRGQDEDHAGMRQRLRLLPFAKYSIAGSEFGVSVCYYHGTNAIALDNLIETAEALTVPIYTIEGALIDSVSTREGRSGFGFFGTEIFLSDGTKVTVGEVYRCGTPDLMIAPLAVVLTPFTPWMLESWYFPSFYSTCEGQPLTLAASSPLSERGAGIFSAHQSAGEKVWVNLDSLVARAERGEDLVFTRYPAGMVDEFKKKRESLRFWRDFSFGIAGIRVERSED